MAAKLQSPEKELRFTRAAQAIPFWIGTAVLAATGLTLLSTSIYRDINPHLPHPAWALLPLSLCFLTARLAIRLTRHAYLILTPLGIEIFPFFRPAAGMQMIVWQEIHHADADDGFAVLTLHRNVAETSGIRLSMKPVRKDRRSLLAE